MKPNNIALASEKKELFALQSLLYAVCDEYVKKADFYPKSVEKNLPVEIFEYTRSNFKDDISMQTMAHVLGYNYHYMSRIFN